MTDVKPEDLHFWKPDWQRNRVERFIDHLKLEFLGLEQKALDRQTKSEPENTEDFQPDEENTDTQQKNT